MNTKSLVTFILVTIGILAGSVALLWRFGSTGGVKAIPDIAGSEKHVKGTGNITIVEFSDLQCPACKSVQEPLKQLLTKYDGKVKLVYRHFPLTTIHKNAVLAAQASEAADKQGKFWEMHDILFDRQTEWEKADDPTGKFAEYAATLGMNKEVFMTDMQSQDVKDAVMNDNLAATRYALSGTPTFFVNGFETDFAQLEAKIAEFSP